MNTRSRTIASFFSVAMAAMLFGAVVTNQIQRPAAAEARNLDPEASPRSGRPGRLDHPRHLQGDRAPQTAGVVNISTKKVVRRRGAPTSSRTSSATTSWSASSAPGRPAAAAATTPRPSAAWARAS